MEVKEILQKMEPVVGLKNCKGWWLAYLAQDAKGRQDLRQYLEIKALYMLGIGFEENVLLPPPPKNVADQGKYSLGTIAYGKNDVYPFALRDEDLLSHLAIVGRSGSGKTNLTLHLIDQFIRNNTPFWIFDFKRNYRDLLSTHKDLVVYTVGRDVANIHDFNPLIPLGDPHNHIRRLVSLLCKAFFLGEGVASLLIRCFDQIYQHFSIYTGQAQQFPTFRHVQQWLEAYKPKNAARDGQWLQSTLRAIRVLNFGVMGKAMNVQHQFPIKEYLGKRVVFELDALSKQDKTFVLGLLLHFRHEYKLEYAKREKLQDVLIIEEAHHLLPRKAIGEEESILETLLREERELGTSFIIIDQLASRLSDVAFANTATTIALNQKHNADINTIANALILSQEDKTVLSKLKIGEAIVRQQERWPNSFLVRIPHYPIAKGSITDNDMKHQTQKQTIISEYASENLQTGFLSGVALKLARSIKNNSSFTVSQHYQILNMSPRVGNAAKQELLTGDFAVQKEMRTNSAKIILLQLTKKGDFFLSLQTQQQFNPSNKSAEHLYFEKRIAELLKNRGEAVEVEPQLQNCRPDIWLPEKNIAIEVETGKSKHIVTHVKTHLEQGREVIVAATNKEAYDKSVSKLQAAWLFPNENVRILIPKLR